MSEVSVYCTCSVMFFGDLHYNSPETFWLKVAFLHLAFCFYMLFHFLARLAGLYLALQHI